MYVPVLKFWMVFLHIYDNYGVHTYREINVAASFTTQVIDSHHELLKRYNEGTLFSLLCVATLKLHMIP